MTNEEAIEILGGIRTCYNIFDEWDRGKYHALSMAIEALKSQKHGRWLVDDGCSYCSVCRNNFKKAIINHAKYCPMCGAKMDKEEDNERDD